MIAWLGALALIAGAAVCLLAAVGVLRLPDFFLRMHAATKAGVVGTGLLLAGVALADNSGETWIKILLTLGFLLLTTPVAGHLLGRAGYVGGAPLWQGTVGDALSDELVRGSFAEGAAPPVARGEDQTPVRVIVHALTCGPTADAALAEAVALARRHHAALCGLAIIDVPRLQNVGPIPIGGGWHAQQMRDRRIHAARAAAAARIEHFERVVARETFAWSVRLEEGKPRRILLELAAPGTLVSVARDTWFDQGVLGLKRDVGARLRWPARGYGRLIVTG